MPLDASPLHLDTLTDRPESSDRFVALFVLDRPDPDGNLGVTGGGPEAGEAIEAFASAMADAVGADLATGVQFRSYAVNVSSEVVEFDTNPTTPSGPPE